MLIGRAELAVVPPLALNQIIGQVTDGFRYAAPLQWAKIASECHSKSHEKFPIKRGEALSCCGSRKVSSMICCFDIKFAHEDSHMWVMTSNAHNLVEHLM